jgi:uncharacterized protein (DUF2237 family)
MHQISMGISQKTIVRLAQTVDAREPAQASGERRITATPEIFFSGTASGRDWCLQANQRQIYARVTILTSLDISEISGPLAQLVRAEDSSKGDHSG